MAEQEERTEQAAGEETDAEATDAEAAGAEANDETAAAGEEASTEEGGAADGAEEAETEGAGVVAEQAAVAEDVLETGEEERSMRKERVGTVVSAKMEKTIVVSIERSTKHPMYKKYLTRSARKMTHDENNEAGEGDTVRIMETRPVSKHKRWRLVEILERAA